MKNIKFFGTVKYKRISQSNKGKRIHGFEEPDEKNLLCNGYWCTSRPQCEKEKRQKAGYCHRVEKLWNMVTVIPIMAEDFETVIKNLEKRRDEMEIKSRK